MVVELAMWKTHLVTLSSIALGGLASRISLSLSGSRNTAWRPTRRCLADWLEEKKASLELRSRNRRKSRNWGRLAWTDTLGGSERNEAG